MRCLIDATGIVVAIAIATATATAIVVVGYRRRMTCCVVQAFLFQHLVNRRTDLIVCVPLFHQLELINLP
jgi:hypothetical protein